MKEIYLLEFFDVSDTRIVYYIRFLTIVEISDSHVNKSQLKQKIREKLSEENSNAEHFYERCYTNSFLETERWGQKAYSRKIVTAIHKNYLFKKGGTIPHACPF